MSGRAAEINIEEISRTLETRRDHGQRTVLFLGARAGGLFRNEYLYEIMKKFSLLNFDTLSNEDKFKECYRVLSTRFSKTEINDILVGALGPLRYREEDKLLTGLVKAGFLEGIISTNIDALLEDACSFWGMREPNDYRLFISGIHDIGEIERDKRKYSYIIKAFGDIDSLYYNTAGSEFDINANHRLQKFLNSKLSRNVLIVGYDPVWDRSIERAFPTTGEIVWYVNETALPQNAYLASALDRRDSKFLQGDQGSYSSFFQALHDLLGEKVNREERATMPFPILPQLPSRVKKKVFISYSHKDKEYLERLRVHLMGYLFARSEKDILDIWDDTKISSGTDWKEEIKKALKHTKVAILLVSANFLSSNSKHGLPFLQEAANRGDVKLLPIILDVSASSFDKDRESLYQYQVVNSVSEPLKWMMPYEQEVVWAKLAGQVYDILSSQK